MLVALPGLLCAASLSVKWLFTEEQAILPVNKYGGPCVKVGEDGAGCQGGFPGIAAAIRAEQGTADHVLVSGSFLQIEQLVTEHPRGSDLNEVLWRRLNASSLRLFAPYFQSRPQQDSVDLALYLRRPNVLPVVMSNLDLFTSALRDVFYPYVIHTLVHPSGTGEIRVALLSIAPKTFWAELMPNEYVANQIRVVRAQNVRTIVVCMNYLGVRQNDVDAIVAMGVDVVLHEYDDKYDGDVKPSYKLNGAWVTAYDGSAKQQVVSLSLEYDTGAGEPVLSGVSATSRSAADFPYEKRDAMYHDDEAFVQALYSEATWQDPKLGYSTTPMPHGHLKVTAGETQDSCRHEECHLGTWTADAIRKFVDSDIAFVNGGGLRVGWDEGDVFRSEVRRAVPYKNLLCEMNLTAVEIWRTLEYSVEVVTADGNWNSSARRTGRFLQVSGMRFGFNPELPPGRRVTSMDVLEPGTEADPVWRPIDPMRAYRVSSLNYLCGGGDGFNFAESSDISSAGEVGLWTVLYDDLRIREEYTPFVRGAIVHAFNASALDTFSEGDCDDFSRYSAAYEYCEPCPEGLWYPGEGYGPCLPVPVPTPPRDPTMIILVSVLTVVAVAVLVLLLVRKRQELAWAELTKYAPLGDTPTTFVFTDIMKSSELWAQFPESMAEALSEHHAICRVLIKKHQGYEVKTLGDSFMVAFSSPFAAVEFMMELQVDLLRVKWPADLYHHEACKQEKDEWGNKIFGGLRVRCGCHCGMALVKATPSHGYDYDGTVVNTTARVADSGCGGQVLITHEVYEVVNPYLNDMFCATEVSFLGQFRYRGIDENVAVHCISPLDLATRKFPALRQANPVVEERKVSLQSNVIVAGTTHERVIAQQSIRKWASEKGQGVYPGDVARLLLDGCEGGKETVDMVESVLAWQLKGTQAPAALTRGEDSWMRRRMSVPSSSGSITSRDDRLSVAMSACSAGREESQRPDFDRCGSWASGMGRADTHQQGCFNWRILSSLLDVMPHGLPLRISSSLNSSRKALSPAPSANPLSPPPAQPLDVAVTNVEENVNTE